MKISQKILLLIAVKTAGKCLYCNKPGEVVDHFISRQKWHDWELDKYCGSVNQIENLFLACGSCNSSKKDHCPEDFHRLGDKVWDLYQKLNLKIVAAL